MSLFEEINSLCYLFLTDITQIATGDLIIVVKSATISQVDEDLLVGGKNLGPVRQISSYGPGHIYEFYFPAFSSYCVTNESICILQDNEERIGRLYCRYSKSNYLDYILTTTITKYVQEEELQHYALNCQDYIIDIVTIKDPIIKRIVNKK